MYNAHNEFLRHRVAGMLRSLFLLLLLTLPLSAQTPAKSFADVATVTTKIEPAKAKPGDTITFTLTIEPKPECWTYPAGVENVIRLPKSGDVIFDQKFVDPPNAVVKEVDGMFVDHYPFSATWNFKGTVSKSATPGKKRIILTGTKLQVCNSQNCFFTKPAEAPAADLEILPGSVGTPIPAPPPGTRANPQPSPEQSPPPEPVKDPNVRPSNEPQETEPARTGLVKKVAAPIETYKAGLDDLLTKLERGEPKLPSTDLGGFLATAALWGWISLVTPCVFPMIPITVSLFLKQGNKSPREVLKLAAVYSLTIVLVIGLSALFVLQVFRELSVNPWMNIGLGFLLIVFALSLFGMYDIALPGFLLRYTERKRGAGGMIGTAFGALAFSIVSFTCVAPFLGGFAGFAASGKFSTTQLALGAFAFSAAFASPFFLLALFPTLIKKLPKSGGWLDTIKAVMGFIEVAAALKFFRTAELRLLSPTQYFTFDLCLAGIIITMAVCGLYLLNVFRLPHDEERPTIGVGRLMWAFVFLGLAAHLTPGLMKTSDGQNQRPTGIVYAWMEAFLLPESNSGGGKELPWDSDLLRGIDTAIKNPSDQRWVFVDFTGKTCQNCKLNEHNVFTLPEIDELLRKYNLVQMYTDEVPGEFYVNSVPLADREKEAQVNQLFQSKAFGDERLPLYAILEVQGNGTVRIADVYDEGKINDPAQFAKFLRQPFAK